MTDNLHQLRNSYNEDINLRIEDKDGRPFVLLRAYDSNNNAWVYLSPIEARIVAETLLKYADIVEGSSGSK